MKNRAFEQAGTVLDQLGDATLTPAGRRKVARIRREIIERRNEEILAEFHEALATGQMKVAREIFLESVLGMDEMKSDQHLRVLTRLMVAANRLHTGETDFAFAANLARPDLFFGPCPVPETGTTEVEEPRNPVPFRLLSVAGFNYSGSGAVGDFLSDFEGVQILNRSQCYIGAWRLLGAFGGTRENYARQLCRFVMDACLGLVDTSLSGPEVDSVNWFKRRCLLRSYTDQKIDPAPMITALCDLIDFAASRDPSLPDAAEQLEERLRDFLVWQAIAPQVAPDSRLVIVNNDLKASKVEASRLLPSCPTITVFRDTRDQFVAQMRESTFNRREAGSFIEMIEAHNREYHEGRARLDAMNVPGMELRFEAFILDPEVQQLVLGFTGLSSAERKPGPPRFDAGRSRVNIGIHRDYEDQEAIRRVAGMRVVMPALDSPEHHS